jgi:hypothetical protein
MAGIVPLTGRSPLMEGPLSGRTIRSGLAEHPVKGNGGL